MNLGVLTPWSNLLCLWGGCAEDLYGGRITGLSVNGAAFCGLQGASCRGQGLGDGV